MRVERDICVRIECCVIRNRSKCRERVEIFDMSVEDLVNVIKDYINKFGNPISSGGVLVWEVVTGEKYSMSCYKNNIYFDLGELRI